MNDPLEQVVIEQIMIGEKPYRYKKYISYWDTIELEKTHNNQTIEEREKMIIEYLQGKKSNQGKDPEEIKK